jgi:hypothetical protein
MKTKTNVKAGAIRRPVGNHNETLVRAAGLKVKTGVKAGVKTFESLDDKHKDW